MNVTFYTLRQYRPEISAEILDAAVKTREAISKK
jgi:hypothetical protein